MAYEDNIEHQLRMLEKTWEQFVAHGVTPETELVLEFVYLAPNKASASVLYQALENYEAGIRSHGIFRKRWFIDGKSHPTTVSKTKLTQWLDFMVDLGWQHGCEFDGFGASIPG